MKTIKVKNIAIGGEHPLVLIAGPCVIESEDLAFNTAEKLVDITRKLELPFIFKSSFDKANRTSVESYRGPGMDEGLRILEKVKERFSGYIIDRRRPGRIFAGSGDGHGIRVLNQLLYM